MPRTEFLKGNCYFRFKTVASRESISATPLHDLIRLESPAFPPDRANSLVLTANINNNRYIVDATYRIEDFDLESYTGVARNSHFVCIPNLTFKCKSLYFRLYTVQRGALRGQRILKYSTQIRGPYKGFASLRLNGKFTFWPRIASTFDRSTQAACAEAAAFISSALINYEDTIAERIEIGEFSESIIVTCYNCIICNYATEENRRFPFSTWCENHFPLTEEQPGRSLAGESNLHYQTSSDNSIAAHVADYISGYEESESRSTLLMSEINAEEVR